MKKTRLKKLGHLYATDEMLCMAEQDIPENKKIGWQRVEPVFQREVYLQSKICDGILMVAICRLPRYLTKPRQRRSEWDMAGSDGISRVSTVFRGKSLLTNKMRII